MDIFQAIELIKKHTQCSEELFKQINICLNVIQKNEEISEKKMITIGYAILIHVLNSNTTIIKENYSIEEFNQYLLAIKVVEDYLDGIKVFNKLIE